MMDSRVFQLIFDEISNYLPRKWETLIIYLEYGEASYSFEFYVKTDEKYTKCFDLPGVTDKQLADSFRFIDRAVLKEREKLKKDLWSNMTMIIRSDGSMHTDFDYTDLSENAYRYKKSWKEKYLK